MSTAQRPKSYDQLITDLRSLGMGVLGTHFSVGTLKSCSQTSPEVQRAMQELGHTTGEYGVGGPSHVDFSVLTRDAGWVGVDPTYLQFKCRYGIEDEDSTDLLLPMLRHFQLILTDPLHAFEVVVLNEKRKESKRSPISPNDLYGYGGDSWLEYNRKKGLYAVKSLEAAAGRARMRRIPWWAEMMVEQGLYP